MATKMTCSLVSGFVLALAASLAACSGGSGGDTPSGNVDDTVKDQSTTTTAANELGIEHPKNAAAVDVCSLLPDQAARELGVQTEGKKTANDLDTSASPACTWENADGSYKVSFAVKDGRSIRVYYENQDAYIDFKKFTIAGYPTVRANEVKPIRYCGMFLATNSNQVVQSFAAVPADMRDTVHPCEVTKKLLKLSVSSWPAAQ